METAQGIVSHSQNTSRVSGGGNNGTVSTTYIALFRLEQRQVQFSSGSPLSVTDGDQVIIAGRAWRGTFYADAVRNVTTGITRHSSIVGRIFLALFVLFIGLIVSFLFAKDFGPVRMVIFLGFIAGAAYLLWRALQTINALSYVKSATP